MVFQHQNDSGHEQIQNTKFKQSRNHEHGECILDRNPALLRRQKQHILVKERLDQHVKHAAANLNQANHHDHDIVLADSSANVWQQLS